MLGKHYLQITCTNPDVHILPEPDAALDSTPTEAVGIQTEGANKWNDAHTDCGQGWGLTTLSFLFHS